MLIKSRLIVEWRVRNRVEEQLQAFSDGFHELIPRELINVFDERELEVTWIKSSFLLEGFLK